MAQRFGFGLSGVLVGMLNANGIVIGNDSTGAAAGDVDGQMLFRMRGAQVVPVQSPDPNYQQGQGDDEIIAQIQFTGDTLENGNITTAVRDLALEAKLKGTGNRTYGNMTFGSQNPGGVNPRDVCIIAQRRSKVLSDGTTKWEGSVIPSATLNPNGTTYTSRGIDAYAYAFGASRSQGYPWGQTFVTSVENKTSDTIIPFETSNPFMVQVWQGDGNEDSFNFGLEPAGVTSSEVAIFVNGYYQTIGSQITPITGTGFTVAAGAVANGVYIHAVYEVADLFKKVIS